MSPEAIDRAASAPVLFLDALKSRVTIASLELLRNGKVFLVRARSTDGAEGLAVPNADRLIHTYPIFLDLVAPQFIGKDARDLESLIDQVYRWQSNYKLQGLAFWVCVAAAEFAILDLLGRLAGKSVGDLLGGVRRRDVAVYRASGNRGNTPREEVEHLKKLVAETGCKAIKFRVGGRLSNNQDSLPGRSEALIPLVRETFGEKLALYADSNSSYDARKAIEIGRLMERHRYGFFEEPCRFDHHEETKEVADALDLPIAGGEQESSLYRFRWMVLHRGVDIAQPDLHYFGGFIRCLRVARMANAAGMPCTLHMSGSGLGYLDVIHFASCIEDPGPYQEFKGESEVPLACATSSLRCENGVVRVPSGPGFGVDIEADFVRRAERVRA
ncbi:MAG: mandelate racemase/muconate lactonizing enzyme family protein, partial [Thermoanaerobaculia bacterium]